MWQNFKKKTLTSYHAISVDKYDLGLTQNYQHKIHLKTTDPLYQKQFKIPEARHQFMEQTLEDWLKLGGGGEMLQLAL